MLARGTYKRDGVQIEVLDRDKYKRGGVKLKSWIGINTNLVGGRLIEVLARDK